MTTTSKTATHALRNAYLLVATPVSVYAGYEGYKHSDSYLTKYPTLSNDSLSFIPEKFRQPIYTAIVRSAWTVGSAASGLLFPITLPLYLYHVQTSTVTPSPLSSQQDSQSSSELEE